MGFEYDSYDEDALGSVQQYEEMFQDLKNVEENDEGKVHNRSKNQAENPEKEKKDDVKVVEKKSAAAKKADEDSDDEFQVKKVGD